MKKQIEKRDRAMEIDRRLEKLFPEPKTALHYGNPFELLIATILSAQCRDERVNQVTKKLFKKYLSPGDYIKAPQKELEQDIRSTGFFRNKTKSIQDCCKVLVEKFQGRVPRTLEQLVTFPGVGRKTANLVLGETLGIPGIVVDTHVRRLAQRLDLSTQKNPDKIEADIMPLLPKERWTPFSHELILHGRSACTAKNPDCAHCVLNDICTWSGKPAYMHPDPS